MHFMLYTKTYYNLLGRYLGNIQWRINNEYAYTHIKYTYIDIQLTTIIIIIIV